MNTIKELKKENEELKLKCLTLDNCNKNHFILACKWGTENELLQEKYDKLKKENEELKAKVNKLQKDINE